MPYAQEVPVLAGYIIRAASASDFDINSVRILYGVKAGGHSILPYDAAIAVVKFPVEALLLGDRFAVRYTVRDRGRNVIYATRIDKQHTSSLGAVSGSSAIDAPAEKAPGGNPPDLTVRADGYRIRITGKTRIDWSSHVKAGDWIKYKGRIDASGVAAAASVQIGPNAIGDGEKKLRVNKEHDPSTIPADAKQNYLKDAFTVGYDPKKFPPFKNVAMQAHIEKIGDSLVPVYQRALSASDPAKTDFLFQLIDTKLFRDTLTLSSGIILVPHQVVERMENGSQLGAVLADGIARILVRQRYRMDGKMKASYLSMLAIPVSPYAGLGGSLASELQTKAMEQRGRVSLCLLHDAGYDIAQAPMAWWLLAAAKPEPVSDIGIPDRAAYLYRILRETWTDSIAPSPTAH